MSRTTLSTFSGDKKGFTPHKKMIRIANAGGYWGDDPYALRRQIQGETLVDYISIDFLAEVTMSILQKQRAKDPQAGFAKDFVNQLEPLLEECLKKKIKIITNAGGVNPRACAESLFALARAKGIALRVAIIEGDDIFPRLTELYQSGVAMKNMETGASFERCMGRVVAANAYFGALPVAMALRSEPDIVLCGRVTDTGITLGAMMHEFGWEQNDYNKLAHGIVAGHIIECGAQASGGNFTDWQKVPSFVDIGFPILECHADGTFYVTKHPHSGGLITCQTVREQLLYEMGHPQSYVVPDCIADFTSAKISQDGESRVKVTGVKGRAPTDLLKVSVAYNDGFKATGTLIISGPDARAKSNVFASTFWERVNSELQLAGFEKYEATHTEHVGDDSCHRGLTPMHTAAEVLLRVSVRDSNKDKLNIFRKMLPSMILSGPAGVAVTGGAPQISEVMSYWPALIPQECALPHVAVFYQDYGQASARKTDDMQDIKWEKTAGTLAIEEEVHDTFDNKFAKVKGTHTVSLMQIAHARSGDKGDTANIGLIGRSPECYAWLRDNISASLVKKWFSTLCKGQVVSYNVPNLWAINFLLEESLGGGGTMSLYLDAQGKTFSQALLRCKVQIPEELLSTIEPENQCCGGELNQVLN